MTDSVVDWINHGFNGSPAFIQNPGGFFIDAADQITGAFIANSGPLASLCNGFGLDIRLSLAMNQTNLKSTKNFPDTPNLLRVRLPYKKIKEILLSNYS